MLEGQELSKALPILLKVRLSIRELIGSRQISAQLFLERARRSCKSKFGFIVSATDIYSFDMVRSLDQMV